MHSFKKRLQMDAGVMLIQRGEDFVEFFGFFGNDNTSSLAAISLNHPQLLYSFADHFKSQFEAILSQMRQEKASLFQLKGEAPQACQTIFSKLDKSSIIAYYSDLGFADELAIIQMLSQRELQCLKLLLDGKSAKETAMILGPTRRTIESYFENMKDKLSCWSKQELFSIAKRLKEIGLLP